MKLSATGAALMALLLASTAMAQTSSGNSGSGGSATGSSDGETTESGGSGIGTSEGRATGTGATGEEDRAVGSPETSTDREGATGLGGDGATGSGASTGESGLGSSGDAVGTGTEGTADTIIGGPGGRTFGQNWSTSLGTAFFTDASQSTVRPVDDITSQWGTLSEEDRSAVREDCAAFRADARSTNGAASGGVSDTSTSTSKGTSSEAGFSIPNVDQGTDGMIGDESKTAATTDASGTATDTSASGVTAAHMQQICTAIEPL